MGIDGLTWEETNMYWKLDIASFIASFNKKKKKPYEFNSPPKPKYLIHREWMRLGVVIEVVNQPAGLIYRTRHVFSQDLKPHVNDSKCFVFILQATRLLPPNKEVNVFKRLRKVCLANAYRANRLCCEMIVERWKEASLGFREGNYISLHSSFIWKN